MRKICVITGSRAEYGLLRSVMHGVKQAPDLTLQILATGMHLEARFGHTWQEITADGFEIDSKVDLGLSGDTPLDIARAMGRATGLIAEDLARLAPDMVVVLGDRFEILAAVQACVVMGVPVAHLHGGEASEGVMDESFRHAITKMSNLHFPAAEPYRARILQMGENPDHVISVGAPGLDALASLPRVAKASLEEFLGLSLDSSVFVVTYHPVVRGGGDPARPVRALCEALAQWPDHAVVFTGVNADPGNQSVSETIQDFCMDRPENWCMVGSLGQQRYFSLLALADAVIGNSSSGIIEAPAAGLPTVNIGPRQEGRLRAASVIDCGETEAEISQAISQALSADFRRQAFATPPPYGAGGASDKIIKVLKTIDLHTLTLKRFHNLV